MPIPSSYKQRALLFCLYGYAAWLILQIFLAKFGMEALHKAGFEDSIAAVASRPFVYRALVPAIVRSVADVLPTIVAKQLVSIAIEPEILPTSAANLGAKYVIFSFVAWGCFTGFAYAVRWLGEWFYPHYARPLKEFVLPFAALGLLPLFFRHFDFVYDPATILLFPLALICLLQERYLLYVLMLALCAINKETSVLLIPVALLFMRERSKKLPFLAAMAVLQLGVSLGIYYYITTYMHNRPGEQVEIQLIKYNLRLPILYPYGFVWFVAVVGSLGYLAGKNWKGKPGFLRQAFLVMLVPHLASLMVVGCIDELRVFYEVYTPLFLLMVPTALNGLGNIFALAIPAEPRRDTTGHISIAE